MALKQEEPLTSANLTTVFSLAGNALFTDSVDAGWQLNLPGLGNEVLLGWDSRGTGRKVEYDDLLRPVAVFEQGVTEPRRSVERMAYGGPDHGVRNQCGQLIRHDDPAGTVLFEAFSITDQCVKRVRHFTLDPVAPQWPELEADRQRLLEPGEGAISTWNFGPLNDVLEQVDAKENRQAFRLTLDGRLRETRLQLQGLITWQTLVSDIQYNAEGQVTHETAGNGVQTTLLYRAEDGLLMERRAQGASARWLQHLIYAYDRIGNVLSIEDKALPVRYFANQRVDPVSCYIYDSLYQLIEASGWEAGSANQGPASVGRTDPAAVSNYHQTYCYDEGGNLLNLTHVGVQGPGRKLTAARYSNRCLPWRNDVPPTEEEIAAAFDAKGNLLELDRGRLLTWDLHNQLQSVTAVERESGRDDRETYVYDGGGQRVRKIRALQTHARIVVAEVRYLPGLELRADDGSAQRLQVITVQAGLNSVRVLHWETDPPHGISNDQHRYSLVDHLSSSTLELADDARIISREIYYPFGATAWFAGDDVIEVSYKVIRYSGKERDATGLYYYGLRYYMPWLQRWLNTDPKGFIDGPNLYQMVGNSPMNYVDSDGGAMFEASELSHSVDKQRALVTSVGKAASDVKNSMLNHAYPKHRFKALGRRVVTQLASSAVSAAGTSAGGALGALAGLTGPGRVLGAKVGAEVGSMAADALISKVVDTYQLDRPINFKGNEMNPKAFIESVELKKIPSLATTKLELSAVDPRTPEGRKQLGKKVTTAVVDEAVKKVASKLGSEASGLIKIGREFYQASQGLSATSLSEAYDETPAVIDMLEFRMQAIKTEFAVSGSADPETFERIAELSTQTQAVVQTLERNQDFIELVAPKPYAGRRQSLNGTSRSAPARQMSKG